MATTAGVLATGVWLLVLGHRSDEVLLLHKIAFIVWGAGFAIHFLAYLPRAIRSLRTDWGVARRQAVPGTGVRGMLLAASLGAGLALAVSLLGAIGRWQTGNLG